MQLLSCSDGESDLTAGSSTLGSSSFVSQRSFTAKRNEKGETPLHTACINGQFKVAQSLLQRGHRVNERDFAGWTPLHEAANHSYPTIVQILLDRGSTAWLPVP